MARIVGSDIAYAVPLTLSAGLGRWVLGTIDWHLLSPLLAGSLPGVILGSHVLVQVPDAIVRVSVATTLIFVAGKIALAASCTEPKQ
jgi:uncharacterized protein